MTIWAAAATIYGGILAVAALVHPIRRRAVAAAACIAYSLAALGSGTLPHSLWTELLVPALLLLPGYWLSGFFFRDPQPRLESWLLESDRRLFAIGRVKRWLARSPRWILEAVEAIYVGDYGVVAIGALVAAAHGVGAVTHYWSVVLTAELACYVALPWVRSRPPRTLEPAGALEARGVTLRRLNASIVERASVQANTLPSGHVAGAVAAALAVLPLSTAVGTGLILAAVLIAVAAVAGRYHYGVDCVTGASVAVVAAWLV